MFPKARKVSSVGSVRVIMITFFGSVNRHINLNIKFLSTAWKVGTLHVTNMWLALVHLGSLSEILKASLKATWGVFIKWWTFIKNLLKWTHTFLHHSLICFRSCASTQHLQAYLNNLLPLFLNDMEVQRRGARHTVLKRNWCGQKAPAQAQTCQKVHRQNKYQ